MKEDQVQGQKKIIQKGAQIQQNQEQSMQNDQVDPVLQYQLQLVRQYDTSEQIKQDEELAKKIEREWK